MIIEYFQDSIHLKERILKDENFLNKVQEAIDAISAAYRDGKKVLIAGNGGSAADAEHFAAEIVCTYMHRDRKGYPAIALTTNTSVLTAWSNDFGYEKVFERQVEAFGERGDIFIGISTSGNSENIIVAVKKAKVMGLQTICFLGRDGGKLKNLSDISIIVPSQSTPRIQEIHTLLIHIICEEVEISFVSS